VGYDIKGLGPRSPIFCGIGPREWTIEVDPGQRCVRSTPQPEGFAGRSAERQKRKLGARLEADVGVCAWLGPAFDPKRTFRVTAADGVGTPPAEGIGDEREARPQGKVHPVATNAITP
jgi:hypothetical protein